MPEILTLLTGGLTTGYLVAALFFLRFCRRTRDSSFAIFAIAFLLMGERGTHFSETPRRVGSWKPRRRR